MLRNAKGFFPGVTPSELGGGNLASAVAELFDHLGPVWALEELLGRLRPEQARFAVGKYPRRMGVREYVRIDYGRGLLVAYFTSVSPT